MNGEELMEKDESIQKMINALKESGADEITRTLWQDRRYKITIFIEDTFAK